MKVLIAVTHLLGAGHLTRAAALARAFSSARHEVALVSGGMPSSLIPHDGFAFVQLPPVKTIGTDFRTLLDESGQPADEAYRAERRARLVEAFDAHRPDLLVTELFPLGRRVLADEFLALLERAHAALRRPVVACSVRDILVAPSRPDRIAEAHGRLRRFYDAVFVHGDPALAPLEASWPVDEDIRPLLRYTGYVDEGGPARPVKARNGILVSGGSSAASLPLYRAAMAAAALLPEHPWRILVGRGVGEAEFGAIRDAAPPHAAVERARPDFRSLLAGAQVSVSQAGYNTVVDLLRTGPSAVLVPFEAGNETEQRLRAERLKAMAGAEIVPEGDLSPERLAAAVARALETSPEPQATIALDGAARTVALAEDLVRATPAVHLAWDWGPFQDALDRAADAGRRPTFWWRDDDAAAQTPTLDRLLALARRYEAGLALAVIPADIEPSLRPTLRGAEGVSLLVHGLRHANHAPPREKKAEFGSHRPLDTLAADAREGLERARLALGPRLLPVFVPPWNRVAPDILERLPALGYRGVSTFRDRQAPEAAPGLRQVNAHVDPIDWHGSRSLADPDAVIGSLALAVRSRVSGTADLREPIGFLTHHRVHDEAVWAFCERLLERLSRNTIRMKEAEALFSTDNGSSRDDDALWS
ncbi:glycosyltransferase [Microvirga pudoricolor]|uniref:glycosyltransferase n=1 Tax=Microvirga pudoricolor TaxID=2778729 RepID=UPI00194DF46C|nr:glycosyltransferase [Microvirga pudoricolor]MBM6592561.1 hypothetical protein [Microvirga pudoricolor]